MREFTKSMMSYTWAMSMFGVQQMVNLFSQQQGQQHPVTQAFNNVTGCTEEEMGDIVKATFRTGDNLQRGLVDMMFGIFTLGAFNQRGGGSRTTSNLGQQSADAFREGMRATGQAADVVGQFVRGGSSGWGCGGGGGRGGSSSSGQQSEPTGWGPVPPPRGGSSSRNRRR